MSRIVILPGDGIGPEVAEQARRCLELLSQRCALEIEFEVHDFGGAAIDRHGTPLPDRTLRACQAADAILLGAVGGPKWDGAAERPEAGLLKLRAALGLYANLRPSGMIRGLEAFSPLKDEVVSGADILVVRELTGGSYFGDRSFSNDFASDTCTYTRPEIERIAHAAFAAARRRSRRVTSVDKANVLATSRLWRQVMGEVSSEYPDVTLDHVYVDAAAMLLIRSPRSFDVIVTENMFGDILSDELAVVSGSIGLLASASLGKHGPGLFEPIHGSAPDISGLDIANPAGAIACAAMLLELGLGRADMAKLLSTALEEELVDGERTADLGGTASCSQFGAAVCNRLEGHFVAREAHLDLIASNRGCCG